MKTLHNPQYILFPNKRSIMALGLISLMLLFSGCQTTDTHHTKGGGPSVSVLTAIVYGKVHFKTPQNTDNKAIVIMPYRYPCADRDSAGHSDAIPAQFNGGHIQQSGSYRVMVFAQPWTAGQPSCFKVLPVSYNTVTSNNLDYDSLLATPKMLGAAFDSLLHPTLYPPLDSVRVDFTVNDSTKRAVKQKGK